MLQDGSLSLFFYCRYPWNGAKLSCFQQVEKHPLGNQGKIISVSKQVSETAAQHWHPSVIFYFMSFGENPFLPIPIPECRRHIGLLVLMVLMSYQQTFHSLLVSDPIPNGGTNKGQRIEMLSPAPCATTKCPPDSHLSARVPRINKVLLPKGLLSWFPVERSQTRSSSNIPFSQAHQLRPANKSLAKPGLPALKQRPNILLARPLAFD